MFLSLCLRRLRFLFGLGWIGFLWINMRLILCGCLMIIGPNYPLIVFSNGCLLSEYFYLNAQNKVVIVNGTYFLSWIINNFYQVFMYFIQFRFHFLSSKFYEVAIFYVYQLDFFDQMLLLVSLDNLHFCFLHRLYIDSFAQPSGLLI